MIKLLQLTYINKIFAKFYLDKTYVVNILIKETAISQPTTEGQATTSKREQYQDMTSSIIFSVAKMRPDIAFATLVASRFTKNLSH